MKNIYFLLVSILFLGCPTQPTDDNNNGNGETPPKRDYVWSIDSMVFDVPGYPPPDQIYMYSIWGSSPKNVFAVGQSDAGRGRLWHYDGVKWKALTNWSVNGFDGNKGYIIYPFAVTGFDSQNVFVACDRFYEGYSDSAMVLKWNGSVWSEVPWMNGTRAIGGLGGIVSQGNNKLWAVSSAGLVIKYENGLLSVEPRFSNYRLGSFQIAALDDGKVYVNPTKDSLDNGNLVGSITKLFERNIDGNWSLVENKFIIGTDYDDNGFGKGILGIGNKLFSDNRGLWERVGNKWLKRMSFYGMGGACLLDENNIWTYFNHEVWHFNAKDWKMVNIPILSDYPGSFLYGYGWSDNKEIFFSLHHNGKTYILHGR